MKIMSYKSILITLFLFFCHIYLFSQNNDKRIIIGETVNANLEPLSFVTIKIKGKDGFFMSNMEGKFEIDAQLSDTLIVSLTGYMELKISVKMLNREFNYLTLHERVYELETVDISAIRWQDFKYDMMHKELKPIEQKIIKIDGLPDPYTKLRPVSLVGSPVSFLYEYFKKENIRKRQLKRYKKIYEKTYIKIK
jgi:hypothetical protein